MTKVRFFPETIVRAQLIRRLNRFVVQMLFEGKEICASLPNPGKLGELFIPGAVLFVENMSKNVKYPYRVIAVESGSGETIMLDTHRNNTVARYLIDNASIENLKGYRVKRAEVTVGNSRFDFLLTDSAGDEIFCEVKSCTLFGEKLAMFPDAVTARGKRHVEELGEMGRQGIKTVLLFIIQSAERDYFCPDYHTDLAFSRSLFENREYIQILPVTVHWNNHLELEGPHRELRVLWDLYLSEGKPDRGGYLMLFSLDEGYHLFLSREKEELSKNIERYKRKKKNIYSSRDRMRSEGKLLSTWIIRTSSYDIREMAEKIDSLSTGEMVITEEGYFFYFTSNPAESRSFQNLILYFRMVAPIHRYLHNVSPGWSS